MMGLHFVAVFRDCITGALRGARPSKNESTTFLISPHFVAVFRASGTGLLLARQASYLFQ